MINFLGLFGRRAPAPAPSPPVKEDPPRKPRRRQQKRRNGAASPARPRLRWEEHPAASEIIKLHYPSKRPQIIAAMVASYFPNHKITANMVIGRAHRMGLSKDAREPI